MITLESARLVHKVKKREQIFFFLLSVYEFLQVKGPIISSGIEILLPCLEYVPLYAENNFFLPQ